MTDINNRATVLAVTVESTEGVPVEPSAATQYIRLQGDEEMSPQFEDLQNAERTNSIGQAKSIRGAENPTFSFSHYLRHSGSEGVEPDVTEILKALFGDRVVASTEYDTVASSTESEIKVDTGEGANFQRGQPMLIKDPVNGYSIRPVHSVSGDTITPGFDLPAAPGTGVKTGKAVLYKPTNSGHQTLDLWRYMGNGGAHDLTAGARPTSYDAQIDAGQLINQTFNFEGIGYYFNSINITSSNNKLDFDEDGETEITATIPVKRYKNPHELAAAATNALAATTASDTHTITYDNDTGKFSWASDGSTLNIRWNTGTNTANGAHTVLGFSSAADDSGATTYTADNAQDWSAPHSPTYDSADPIAAKNLEVLIGDADNITSFEASSVSINISLTKVNKPSIVAESGISGSLITGRAVTVNVSGYLSQHDADKFKRYADNQDTRFLLNFGTKVGGNWVPGKCGMFYIPTGTISAFDTPDLDGMVGISFTITAYVDNDGNGEVYLGFV